MAESVAGDKSTRGEQAEATHFMVGGRMKITR